MLELIVGPRSLVDQIRRLHRVPGTPLNPLEVQEESTTEGSVSTPSWSPGCHHTDTSVGSTGGKSKAYRVCRQLTLVLTPAITYREVTQ